MKTHTYDVEVCVDAHSNQDQIVSALIDQMGDGDYTIIRVVEMTDADYRPNHMSEFWTVRIKTPHRLSEAECEELSATEVAE